MSARYAVPVLTWDERARAAARTLRGDAQNAAVAQELARLPQGVEVCLFAVDPDAVHPHDQRADEGIALVFICHQGSHIPPFTQGEDQHRVDAAQVVARHDTASLRRQVFQANRFHPREQLEEKVDGGV